MGGQILWLPGGVDIPLGYQGRIYFGPHIVKSYFDHMQKFGAKAQNLSEI